MYWIVFFGLIIFVASLALNAWYLFRYIWINSASRPRRVMRYLSGLVIAIMAAGLLVELFFAFYARTDPFIHTLAAQNWFRRYWQLNSLGYRDIEWTPDLLESRAKIMVLGDSIVAGHGIENQNNRFADRLGQMLGDDYAVLNVGLHGVGTKTQLEAALEYPYPPDLIILSLDLDDIVDTATALDVARPNFVPTGPRLIEESYAANYFYWHFHRAAPWPWAIHYQDWARGLYHDPGVWETYRSLLSDIGQFAQAQNTQLIVVVFPDLNNLSESQTLTAQIADLFREQNIPVVDVTDLIEGENAPAFMVNPVDWHPNELLHQRVAEALYQVVLEIQ
ncbi:MAG: SGNH/GDSL hydrolase family protein [Anaerolineae bacterium]|nr:SGNH/GDSL hydrolase family protein [Anaerolineae bacterium]